MPWASRRPEAINTSDTQPAAAKACTAYALYCHSKVRPGISKPLLASPDQGA